MSNKIISDYRSEALQGSIKLIDNKGNEKIFIASKPIMVSNQWIPQSKMPVKGDLITIEDKQYRVLKINSTVAEVLLIFNSKTAVKISNSSNKYKDSNLDVYCNETFYNSLSTTTQSAIVDKTFSQDQWTNTSDTSIAFYQGKYVNNKTVMNYQLGLVNSEYGESITRKCYAPSIQHVIDYLEVTTDMTTENTTLTSDNLYTMFYLLKPTSGIYDIHLISARKGYSDIYRIYSANGYISSVSPISEMYVSPVFQIDLSKIEFVKN